MTDRIEADMASGGLGAGMVQLCAVGGAGCTVLCVLMGIKRTKDHKRHQEGEVL